MKLRRRLCILAIVLVMSESLMGSEPEKSLKVRWSELGEMIRGKKVTLSLTEGQKVEGQVKNVTASLLNLEVKKSSDPVAYSKGNVQISRQTVSRIEVRGLKHNKGKQIGLTIVAAFGAMAGSMAAMTAGGAGETSSTFYGKFAAGLGISSGAAFLTYQALRPKGITTIEILPNQPQQTGREKNGPTQSRAGPSIGALQTGVPGDLHENRQESPLSGRWIIPGDAMGNPHSGLTAKLRLPPNLEITRTASFSGRSLGPINQRTIMNPDGAYFVFEKEKLSKGLPGPLLNERSVHLFSGSKIQDRFKLKLQPIDGGAEAPPQLSLPETIAPTIYPVSIYDRMKMVIHPGGIDPIPGVQQ